jgi:flagellar motor switch protein FliN/FliY
MPLQHEAFLPSGGISMATRTPLRKENPPAPPEEEAENPETPTEAENPSPEEQQPEESLEWQEEEEKAEEAVIVELAELVMSVEKLSTLQPGNLLDLDIRPENGASLVVNGKVIGRGELISIGDSVGIRITEIGFTKPRNE